MLTGENFRKYAGIGVVLAVVAAVLVAGGCLSDIVKVDVPEEVQSVTGAGPRVSVSDSEGLLQRYQFEVAAKLKAINKANELWAAEQQAAIEKLASQTEAEAERRQVELEDAVARAGRAGETLKASAEAGREKVAQFSGVGWAIADQASPWLNTVLPLGIASAFTGLLGFFMPRPAERRAVAQANARADTATERAEELAAKADSEWEHGYKIGLAAKPVGPDGRAVA